MRRPRPGKARLLLSPLLALLLALLISAPTLGWQATHGWPELRVARVLSRVDGASGRLLLLPLQLIRFSPILIPVVVVGLRQLLRDDELRWARGRPPSPTRCLGIDNQEQHAEVVLCTGAHRPWSVLWPSLREY
ncbi:hypothetical protein ACWCPS_36915 [Streptomyces mauvecolor]